MEKPKGKIDKVKAKTKNLDISNTDTKIEPALKVLSEELLENIFMKKLSVTSALGKVSQKFQKKVTDLIIQKNKDQESKLLEDKKWIYIGRVDHENFPHGAGMFILDNGDVYIGDFENDTSAANLEILKHEGDTVTFCSYIAPGHWKVDSMYDLDPKLAELLAEFPPFPVRQYLKAEHRLMPILGPFMFVDMDQDLNRYRGQCLNGERTGYGFEISHRGDYYQEAIWQDGRAQDGWQRFARTDSRQEPACWPAKFCAAMRAQGRCACGKAGIWWAQVYDGEKRENRWHGPVRFVTQGDGWRHAEAGLCEAGEHRRGRLEWHGLLALVPVQGEARLVVATAYEGELKQDFLYGDGRLHGEGWLTDEHGVAKRGLFNEGKLVMWLDK